MTFEELKTEVKMLDAQQIEDLVLLLAKIARGVCDIDGKYPDPAWQKTQSYLCLAALALRNRVGN